MKIPKFIRKNNHKYRFVRRCNKYIFLYEDVVSGHKECFSRFDVGMIKEIKLLHKSYIHPERKYM